MSLGINRPKPQTAKIIFLLFLSFLLIVLDGQFHVLNRVHAFGERFALPLRLSAAWPEMLIDNVSGYFIDKTQLLRQNAVLQQALTEEQVKLQALTPLQAGQQELKAVSDLQQAIHLPLTITRVVNIQGYPYLQQLFIRHQDNVDINSAVLAPEGVVGQVITSNTAIDTVLPIVDTKSYVPVQTVDGSMRAIAQGDGKNGLLIQSVSKSNTLAVGETFVTSGLGGVYPKGYPIGTVVAIVPSEDHLFLTLTLKPTVNLPALNYVAVLTSGEQHA